MEVSFNAVFACMDFVSVLFNRLSCLFVLCKEYICVCGRHSDFFPMFTEQFQKKIKVIEMVDFLELEFKDGGLLSWVNATQKEKMMTASKSCVGMKIGECGMLDYFLL